MECFINGRQADVTEYEADELVTAIIISLFSWRRSNDDDGFQVPHRQGCWGDTFATVTNDRIGSRLWLLSRKKITDEVVARAKAYAEEALQWLVDDALAVSVNVEAIREGQQLALLVEVVKPNDTQSIKARFQNLWS